MSNVAIGATNFADDGKDVIQRTIETKSEKHDQINELYEIDRTVQHIIKGGFKRIALQFPDEYLADAAAVAEILRNHTNQQIFVLADTSYGSCCVDEVAAEHVNADLIVHYGRSCLSPTSRLPVLYVFGQQPLDIQHIQTEFEGLFPDRSQSIIMMCDVEYSYAMKDLVEKLSTNYKNLIPTIIQTESKLQHTLNDESSNKPSHHDSSNSTNNNCCGKCNKNFEDEFDGDEDEDDHYDSFLDPAKPADIEELKAEKKRGGRYFELPKDVPLESCSIFFVGAESLTLTNILMVYNKCPLYTYNPKSKETRKETVAVNRMLMKRYFLVQKAKDANTIGIVVGTLGVASYLNIIDHLKRIIKASGRKAYFFVMGKLNIAKMANFMEVDCYVLVSCPENSLIDSKEFYRPIVTPFELELALVKGMEWTGNYITDFSKLLPQLRTDNFTYDDEETENDDAEDVSSDEERHFSLVTGQYVSGPFNSKVHKKGDGEIITSKLTDLTLRSKETDISVLLNSTAGEYLKNRTFRGLEANIGQDEAAEVQEGLSGIARGYAKEKQNL
ncbi:diphthamide biosynthesis protein 2 [Cokeromyces recurvatus]|uniref:diphthamide biosynthesis protein 2 n=1 Tax=Cokeromyces recurvatus TaxID=90255 RepID=UPI00221FCA8F|nr:diphthamide biosynthesis protein 2 [Cokeromyces recurvatus]KAI7900874.1 diphthamide biosynthesis protein 2 [Cokeromyces recurvatus]